MNHLPQAFIEKMQAILGDEADLFFSAIVQNPKTAIRFNPKKKIEANHLPLAEKVAWHNNAFFLNERPSFVFDPLFHAGAYYVQEASSMFIDFVLKQIKNENSSYAMADLCAAPGGKTTVLADNMQENDVLFCNEIISTRNHILRENIAKWGISNAIVAQNNIDEIAKIGTVFDIVLIDAPCSGEGLFRRSHDATKEWSPSNVAKCALRQEEILTHTADLIKQNGYLIYSTCTFEPEENIAQIIALQKIYNCQSIAIDLPADNFDNQITIIQKENAIGYSFYPHKTAGEGFFCSVLQFTNQQDSPQKSKEKQANKNEFVSKNEIELLRKFATIENHTIEKFGANYYALSDSVVSLFKKVNALNIKSVGVKLGEIKGKDVIPSQELSLSFLLNTTIPTIDLPLETALQFLKTEAINLEGEIGWNTVNYHGLKLGWVKVLQNRCNNYFPKEWKIRKEIDL